MDKIAIIADIHGNRETLKTVYRDLKKINNILINDGIDIDNI